MSVFNTDLTPSQREKRIIHKAVGDYIYTAENNGFNNYRIIGKVLIE